MELIEKHGLKKSLHPQGDRPVLGFGGMRDSSDCNGPEWTLSLFAEETSQQQPAYF
jgi:hypothetical protein